MKEYQCKASHEDAYEIEQKDTDRMFCKPHHPETMIQSKVCFVLLFASAYIVNFIYCTSRTVGDISPHPDVDLTLRLGPPEAVNEPRIAHSTNPEVNPAHSMQIIGSKRKRKYERFNVNPNVSERETADRSSTLRLKRNESSRLSAARRRQAIKEKVSILPVNR